MSIVVTHDSAADTRAHIQRVRALLCDVIAELRIRAVDHDHSKLLEPEKSAFDKATPRLRSAPYGTPEYQDALTELGPALQHHYSVNRHHPEHHQAGVNDMTLIDLTEMVCDWVAAATERGVDPRAHLATNAERFKIEPQLLAVISNTVDALMEGGTGG